MNQSEILKRLEELYNQKIIHAGSPNNAIIIKLVHSDQMSPELSKYILFGFIADSYESRKYYSAEDLGEYLKQQSGIKDENAIEYLADHFDDLIALSLNPEEREKFKIWKS